MPDFLNTLPSGREVKERFWSEDDNRAQETFFRCGREQAGLDFLKALSSEL
ncbi:hypothetical protein CHS0354_026661 [Potamilus streckersoni]|uniref:Uncharacterized protein n=1 Tax=Potamilus streckersoni TaxID=2493646 RepID=A0AAE0VS24_9BIVA|nr:hypothetical protein CHS0354_026661 [Potamilus streckersoni]